jgi:transposase-like protein
MKREKRTWTVEEKLSILKEAEEKGVTQTCRKHSIYQSLFYIWKEKFGQGAITKDLTFVTFPFCFST